MTIATNTRPPWLLLSLLAGLAGCWTHVEDHCPACVVLSEKAPDVPRLTADTPAMVVLVHGAFGFGEEWDAVVAALKKHAIDFYAWSWPGPWRRAPQSMARFAFAVQQTLDALPASVSDLVLIAHSAGGALAENAARVVRVPAGHRLRVVAIAPARRNLSAPRDPRFSDEALAETIVLSQRVTPPLPPRVTIDVYLTEDAPRAPPPAEEPGIRRVYLGASVGHTESVARVAVPLVDDLAHKR